LADSIISAVTGVWWMITSPSSWAILLAAWWACVEPPPMVTLDTQQIVNECVALVVEAGSPRGEHLGLA